MRRALAAVVLLSFVGCGDGGYEADSATRAACRDWDALQAQGQGVTDDEAVARLQDIMDRVTNSNIRNRARDLAIALESDATSTEVREAFLDMDAACAAATN